MLAPLLCSFFLIVLINIQGSSAHSDLPWRRRGGRRHGHSSSSSTSSAISFVHHSNNDNNHNSQRHHCRSTFNRKDAVRNYSPLSPMRVIKPTILSHPQHRQSITIKNSADDNNGNEDTNNNEDPDGIPLFDTNEQRATLFGLEPNAELDPLDNGLQFTGPVILLASIYVTLSLFFADTDVIPPLDPLNL